MPRDKKFTWGFIDQCASFPNGKHDDMVDSMSQALTRLIFSKSTRKIIRQARNSERSFNVRNTIKKRLDVGDKINVI